MSSYIIQNNTTLEIDLDIVASEADGSVRYVFNAKLSPLIIFCHAHFLCIVCSMYKLIY